jgi:hypothetical protein
MFFYNHLQIFDNYWKLKILQAEADRSLVHNMGRHGQWRVRGTDTEAFLNDSYLKIDTYVKNFLAKVAY